jgi:hypothetical protein
LTFIKLTPKFEAPNEIGPVVSGVTQGEFRRMCIEMEKR